MISRDNIFGFKSYKKSASTACLSEKPAIRVDRVIQKKKVSFNATVFDDHQYFSNENVPTNNNRQEVPILMPPIDRKTAIAVRGCNEPKTKRKPIQKNSSPMLEKLMRKLEQEPTQRSGKLFKIKPVALVQADPPKILSQRSIKRHTRSTKSLT